jgi:hypothetical protein
MTTSSGEDLPRNIEFLYSKNQLNVAISRALSLPSLHLPGGRPGLAEARLRFIVQHPMGQGVQNLFLFPEVTVGNRQSLMHGVHRFPDVSRVFDVFKPGPDLVVFGMYFGNQFVVRQMGFEGGEKQFFLEGCVRVQLGRQGRRGTLDLCQFPSCFGQIFDGVEQCVERSMLTQQCVDQFHGYSPKSYLLEPSVHPPS